MCQEPEVSGSVAIFTLLPGWAYGNALRASEQRAAPQAVRQEDEAVLSVAKMLPETTVAMAAIMRGAWQVEGSYQRPYAVYKKKKDSSQKKKRKEKSKAVVATLKQRH